MTDIEVAESWLRAARRASDDAQMASDRCAKAEVMRADTVARCAKAFARINRRRALMAGEHA